MKKNSNFQVLVVSSIFLSSLFCTSAFAGGCLSTHSEEDKEGIEVTQAMRSPVGASVRSQGQSVTPSLPGTAVDAAVLWWQDAIQGKAEYKLAFELSKDEFLSNLRSRLSQELDKGNQEVVHLISDHRPEGMIAEVLALSGGNEFFVLPTNLRMAVTRHRVAVNEIVVWENDPTSVEVARATVASQPSHSSNRLGGSGASSDRHHTEKGFDISDMPWMKLDLPGYHVNNQVTLESGNLESSKHKRTNILGFTETQDKRESIGKSGISEYKYHQQGNPISNQSTMTATDLNRHGYSSEHKTTESFGGFYKSEHDSKLNISSKGIDYSNRNEIKFAGHKSKFGGKIHIGGGHHHGGHGRRH